MATAVVTEYRRPLVHVLGVPVDVTDLSGAVNTILRWGSHGKARAVFLRDVHGVMRSVQMPKLMQMHEKADLVLADGTPLTWISRWRGVRVGRVPGTDLVDSVCHASAGTGLKHYFFGGAPGVAERMANILKAKYPGLTVAGCYSPPRCGAWRPVRRFQRKSARRSQKSPQAVRISFGSEFPHQSRRPGSQKQSVAAAWCVLWRGRGIRLSHGADQASASLDAAQWL